MDVFYVYTGDDNNQRVENLLRGQAHYYRKTEHNTFIVQANRDCIVHILKHYDGFIHVGQTL